MSEKVKELRAQLEEARSRVREIDAENAGQYLDPTSSEGEEWNRLNEEIDKLERTIEQCEQREARVSELFESGANTERGASFHTVRPDAIRGEDIWDLAEYRKRASSPEGEVQAIQDGAKRAIERCAPAHQDAEREGAQGHMERLQGKLDGERDAPLSRHILATGSPAYRRAFLKGITRRGVSAEEQRALDLAGETGGYLLPFTLDPTIIPVSNGVVNPLRSIARVEQTTTDKWKGATSGGMKARFREAEGEEAKDNSPKFAQPEVDAHAADSYAEWTYEFGQDHGSIDGELAVMVQDAKDELEAEKFLSGSGEKEPFGLATGATTLIETAGVGTFAVGDVYALEEALPARFRPRGQWVGARGIYNKIRQFDTEGGADLWVPNLKEGLANAPTGNMATRLLDYPTNELSTMESKVTKDKTILFFGDFRYFLIADRIGTSVKPIDSIPGENGRPTGKAGLYFFWRVGSKVLSSAAFRGLKVKKE